MFDLFYEKNVCEIKYYALLFYIDLKYVGNTHDKTFCFFVPYICSMKFVWNLFDCKLNLLAWPFLAKWPWD